MGGFDLEATKAMMKPTIEPRPTTYKPGERVADNGHMNPTPWGSKRASLQLDKVEPQHD